MRLTRSSYSSSRVIYITCLSIFTILFALSQFRTTSPRCPDPPPTSKSTNEDPHLFWNDRPRAPTPSPDLTPVDMCELVVMIFTSSKYHRSRILDIKNSWWKSGCSTDPAHNFIIASSADEDIEGLPAYDVKCGDGYDASMGCKVKESWKLARKLYPNAQWFITADDDSYISLENVLHFVSHYRRDEDVYVGQGVYVWFNGANYASNGVQGYTAEENVNLLKYTVGWFGMWNKPIMDRLLLTGYDQLFEPLIKAYFFPDVVTGLIMRAMGVRLTQDLHGYMTGTHDDPLLTYKQEQYKNKLLATHGYHNTTEFIEFYQWMRS